MHIKHVSGSVITTQVAKATKVVPLYRALFVKVGKFTGRVRATRGVWCKDEVSFARTCGSLIAKGFRQVA